MQVSFVTPQENERDLRKYPLGQVKATWHSVLPKLVAALCAPVSPHPAGPCARDTATLVTSEGGLP